jgi:GxxExxY protein
MEIAKPTGGEGGREPSQEVDRLAYEVIGAAIEVHRKLGPGFLEKVYEEALCVELELRGIPFRRQVPIGLVYKGRDIGRAELDLLVGELPVVELKAVEAVVGVHTAQLLSYLKATGHRLGLLINFNVCYLKEGLHRIVLS